MKAVRISSKGQIAIPQEIRKIFHIKPGDEFFVKIVEGRLLLEPVITIPKNQAWFWTDDIQDTIKVAEEHFKEGNARNYTVSDLLQELKD